MTLITKLGTSFTDTALPVLQKDPVIPNTGGVVLYDFKSPSTWASQGSPITSYSSLVGTTWPTLTASDNNATYSSSTGRVTASAAAYTSLPTENAGNRLFADLTANYCLSIWIFKPSTAYSSASPAYFSKCPQDFSVSLNQNQHSLAIEGNSGINGVRIMRPASTDGNAQTNIASFSSLATGVHRLGYAWAKNSGQWQHRSILNNGTASAWANSTFGTGTNGVQENSAWTGRLFGHLGGTHAQGLGIYRFYLENLTLSTRTPEQVWAADWARGNGRFS